MPWIGAGIAVRVVTVVIRLPPVMTISGLDVLLRIVGSFDIEIYAVATARILLIRNRQGATAHPATCILPEPGLRVWREVQAVGRIVDIVMRAWMFIIGSAMRWWRGPHY